MNHWRTVAILALSCVNVATLAAPGLPRDVAAFLERRQGCDHWRGEYSEDKERRSEINANACTLCAGTDARLASLKRKYDGNADVKAALGYLEPHVERPSPKAAAKACKAAIVRAASAAEH